MRKIKRITSFIVLTVLFAMTMFSGCGKQASSVTVADVNDAALEAESVQVTAESVSALSAEEYDMSKIDQTFLQDKEITNILIVGQDRRERARISLCAPVPDTMIIYSINRRTGEIGLSSLMRDLYVPISGYKRNKDQCCLCLRRHGASGSGDPGGFRCRDRWQC